MHNFMHKCHNSNEPASPTFGKGGEAVLKRIRKDDTRSLTKKPNPQEFNDPADSLLGCGSVNKAPLMRNSREMGGGVHTTSRDGHAVHHNHTPPRETSIRRTARGAL